MVRQPNESLDAQKSVALKLSEPAVDSNNPWIDDLLDRQAIAKRITNLVATQELPLSVSLNGPWGTGKTFMLKRWQKDLEGQGFKAIYFNAWEDDFCDDPLLAIIGQLSSYFTEGRFQESVQRVANSALPLIRSNASSVLTHLTGLKPDYEHDSPTKSDLIKQYLGQRHSKDMLKNELETLAARVYAESNHSLIFIVDELDRCRPTFAIELLERVKHVFEVPNLVFVFGINRNELCGSLSSIYGEINTDVYLRRFFDFEFNLSEVDLRGFAEQLIDRFQLVQVFQKLDEVLGSSADPYNYPGFRHTHDYDNYRTVIPKLWSALVLSLRDIDYGIRLLAVLARNIRPRTFTHPYLLAILIAMKFKKPEFYGSLITGNFETSEVMDYIDGELRREQMDEELTRYLDRSEGFLYCADSNNNEDQDQLCGQAAVDELSQTPSLPLLPGSSVISDRAQKANRQQRDRIVQGIAGGRQLHIDGRSFGNLAALVDTYQTQLRR